MTLKPHPKLDDKWIESQLIDIQVQASDYFFSNPSPHMDFLEADEKQRFMEIYNARTDFIVHTWYNKCEYKVIEKTEELLRNALKATKMYNVQVQTEMDIDDGNQALADATFSLVDLHAESWYNFLCGKKLL